MDLGLSSGKVLKILVASGWLWLGGCGPADPDVSPLLGTWEYRDGMAEALCGDTRLFYELAGKIQLEIAQSGDEAVSVRAGPRCLIGLALDGPQARLRAAQDCRIGVQQSDLDGRFETFSLTPDGEALVQQSSGTMKIGVPTTGLVSCHNFQLEGVLQRVAEPGLASDEGPE